VLIYFLAMRAAFNYQRTQLEQAASAPPVVTRPHLAQSHRSLLHQRTHRGRCRHLLPFIGTQLAQIMAGTTRLLARFSCRSDFATRAGRDHCALRINALDMAIANLLGSNLFDIFILAIDDMLYVKAPFFRMYRACTRCRRFPR